MKAHSFEMCRALMPVLAVTALLGVAGCGGSGDSNEKADAKDRSSTGPKTQTAEDEPAKAKTPTTPEGAVENLWSRLGAASFPLAVTLYDRKVVKDVGAKNIVGALTTQRANFVGEGLKISKVERTDQGVLVTVKREIKGKPARENSYLLIRRKGKWYVQYDSILADGLAAYVQTRTQRRIDRKAKKPSVEALAAGRAASQKYIQLFAGP